MRNAWHAVGMARTAEALLVGVALALASLAAAAGGGAAPAAPAVWGVSVAAGALMGAAWFLDLRPRAERIARAVDARLRLDGRLVTAWEREVAGDGSAIARLLSQEVRARVRPAAAVRAALPASLPLLGAPLLAAAWLGVALEGREGGPPPLRGVAPALEGIAEELRAAEDRAFDDLRQGLLGREELQRIGALARRADALARECARHERSPAPGDPAGAPDAAGARAAADPEGTPSPTLRRRVDGLCDEIEALAERAGGSRELSEALDRVATLADAARRGAGAPGAGGGSGDAPGEGRGGGASALANGEADGTMSAPPSGTEASDPRLPTAPPPPDAGFPGDAAPDAGRAGGIGAGRWWPGAHDGVVGRWIEDRRARRATGDGPDPPD